MGQICKKCLESKDESQFRKYKNAAGEFVWMSKTCLACESEKKKLYFQKNKPAYAARTKQWRKENPNKKREEHLRQLYGISVDDYEKMLAKQNGVCAVCKKPRKRLCVDHCHKTKKVRGLLCGSCNLAIGNAKEDIKILHKLIDYLRENK